MKLHLRVARPMSNLTRARSMYTVGLGLKFLGSFEDHEGFDGVMLEGEGLDYHFEFTHCRAHPVAPRPTAEDLVAFYIPNAAAW